MNKTLLSIFIIATSIINAADAKPINLPCAKLQIIAYYNELSPESDYIKDVNTLILDAEKYLDDRVAANNRSKHPAKLAMVLDIDDTSVSHYPSIKADDFSNVRPLQDKRYHAGNAPTISPVLRLYKEAIKKGVAVFFITVRRPLDLDKQPSEDLRPYTIQGLRNAGYEGWTALYLPQGEEMKLSNPAFKTKMRQLLTKQGYDIILNIGDQETDLQGGYADHTEKLPNYLYSSSETPCDGVMNCLS